MTKMKFRIRVEKKEMCYVQVCNIPCLKACYILLEEKRGIVLPALVFLSSNYKIIMYKKFT